MTDTQLLTPLRAALAAREQAPGTAPVRVHNRLMTAVTRACERLAEMPAGRSALAEAAASDPDPWLRLVAATTVQQWDLASARATLEGLVTSSGGSVVRPMTMTAALAVEGEPGRSAALCLLNLDSGKGPAQGATPVAATEAPVASPLLDAAERVYNLAMNGGIDHAFETAGEQFLDAAQACDAVGAAEEASVLREVVALLSAEAAVDTRQVRAEALKGLNSEQDLRLQALNVRFCATDDLMERLEVAAEG